MKESYSKRQYHIQRDSYALIKDLNENIVGTILFNTILFFLQYVRISYFMFTMEIL